MLRDSILASIQKDPGLGDQDRLRAEKFFLEVPVSQLLGDKEFVAKIPNETIFDYFTFRWMILISEISIFTGGSVFLFVGICVLLSMHSLYVQYLSLSVGWHVLRIYGALQAVAQGVILLALSYWITALWFDVFVPKLIFLVGLLVFLGVLVLVVEIFRSVNNSFEVTGQILLKQENAKLWSELNEICSRVGAVPPDQIIAGIDDNFFVTEHSVTVGGTSYNGRTLFVSLSLLRELRGGEADAILAHEMAHFSGQDTLYSLKVTPLLIRYGNYLEALRAGIVTLPIYYFMLCFRALFQLSLGRLSRQREFRADQIASEVTSATDMAGALLRTVAYSQYRQIVEQGLLNQERVLETANVCERIQQGFHEFAAGFASGPNIDQLASIHPFDSHPPVGERLHAVGLSLDSSEVKTILLNLGDGAWFKLIRNAGQMEKEQWQDYEDHFRLYHEQSLPYRFLPENPEEYEIVVKAFPKITFECGLTLCPEKMNFEKWPDSIRYSEISKIFIDDSKVLRINYHRMKNQVMSIKMSGFSNYQEMINSINLYYGRYLAAVEYQKQKKRLAKSENGFSLQE